MARKRKSDSLDIETMVDRILAAYYSAEPWQLKAGARWYDNAQQWVRDAAKRHQVDAEVVAGVVAAYSPQTRWVSNLVDAEYHLAGRPLRSGVMGSNVNRARNVELFGLDGLGKGPKVNAFARNILGDTDAVTVDVWAARAALDTEDERELANTLRWVGAYQLIADAYRKAAAETGVTPHVMQATVWVVTRGKAD